MVNEPALKDALLALAEIEKRQLELQVSLMAEIAAVRNAFQGLDPTFADTFALKRQEVLKNITPSFAGLVFALEEITRKLKSGDVC